MHKSTRASGIGDCVVVATAAENWQRSRRRAAAAACRQWLWQRSTGQRDDGCAGPPRPGSDGRRRAVRWRLRASEGGSSPRPAHSARSANGRRSAGYVSTFLLSLSPMGGFSFSHTLFCPRSIFVFPSCHSGVWMRICDLSLVFCGHLLLSG